MQLTHISPCWYNRCSITTCTESEPVRIVTLWGPPVSCSLYIWCQVFYKITDKLLIAHAAAIPYSWLNPQLADIPTSTSVVYTLRSLANLLATGLKLTSRSSQHVSGLQTWCRSVLLRVCVSMLHGPPECRTVCMQTECQCRCPLHSNIRTLPAL